MKASKVVVKSQFKSSILLHALNENGMKRMKSIRSAAYSKLITTTRCGAVTTALESNDSKRSPFSPNLG